MPEIAKINGIKVRSWDQYLEETAQSASRDTVTQPLNEDGEGPKTVREQGRKASATKKLLILHAELRGLYGEIVPVGNDCKTMRKLNSVERYVIRNAGKWEVFERLLAREAALHSPGIWMPTIARALANAEKKKERHFNSKGGPFA